MGVTIVATHLGEEFMSCVTGVTLICAVVDRPVLDRLNQLLLEDGANATSTQLVDTSSGAGGNRHPQMITATAGWSYSDDVVERLTKRVGVANWLFRSHVVLVVNPEHRPMEVYRFRMFHGKYEWEEI